MTIDATENQSGELMTRIVNSIRDAVMVTNLKGDILEVNPAFERLFGYNRNEAIGKPVSILKSGKHDDTFYHHLWQAARRGMVWEGHIYNKRKDGSVILVEETINAILDTNGMPDFYLATLREPVTHDWESEKGHRVDADHEALTACLAHDLSNLVTPILGNTGTALLKMNNGDDAKEEVEAIGRSAQRAKDLVRQVLALCRHEYGGHKGPVALNHIVRDVINTLLDDLPPNVELKTGFSHGNMLLTADPIQMHQVLLNLCNNSLTAMKDKGGTLEIALENVVVNANSPYLGDLDEGTYLKLSVIDDGVGMNIEGQRRAFDPFFSTRSKADGHGLGLSIVRRIVENHGGKVYLKSQIGEGCRVDVLLPTGAAASITETQQIPVSVMPVASGTILLVDDEHSILQMGKNMLEYAGYSVVGMSGSEQALACFQRQPEKFDLIVADHVMFGMSGFDMAKIIRKERADVPIIFITGYTNEFPKDDLQKLGNCRLLPKPFSSDELLALVRDLGNGIVSDSDEKAP